MERKCFDDLMFDSEDGWYWECHHKKVQQKLGGAKNDSRRSVKPWNNVF